MGDFMVAGVCIGKTDVTGAMVDTIYAKRDPVYAVYRSSERVMVHLADDPVLAAAQQATLVCLNSVRGEIDGLIDGWRGSKAAKAASFDRRVADALIIALQGFACQAQAMLQATRGDLVEERTSWARFQYLLAALAATLVTVGLTVSISAPWFRNVYAFEPVAQSLWSAVAVGALGAFFSIAIGIRSRTVLTDLQTCDNVCDAALRIVIGATAAALLIALAATNLIQFTVAGTSVSSGAWLLNFIIAFVGGFSERLVPDLLERATQASQQPPAAGLVPVGGLVPRPGQDPVSAAAQPVPDAGNAGAERPALSGGAGLRAA